MRAKHPTTAPPVDTAARRAAETGDAVAETHSATVFFHGQRAYKVKKPVDLGFLDFSTLQQRREACWREVALNRRLAPDVYLGVADVVGPDGEICDHLVVMRRMPDDRRLSELVRSGEDVTDALREVARQMAVLHAGAATSADDAVIGQVATRDAVLANWRDNLQTLRGFAGTVLPHDEVAEVWTLAESYLRGRGKLLAQRIRDGLVRDGHGDLMADDIFCLDDGPRILDCLDFSDRYRYGDVLLDVAFLAMDLHRLGRPDLADDFLHTYVEFSGEHHPATLAHHYVAYRAHVRAKVACLRHAQGEPAAAAEAARLHALARSQLRRGEVVLALVGGLPGSGKTTVATALADARGWALLSSDEVRKDLHGLGHHDDAQAAYGHGLYAPESVAAVYDELLRRSRRLLEQGLPVVLDASWSSAWHRQAAARVAGATSASLVQLRCEAPARVCLSRLSARPPGSSPSDATPEVWQEMRRHAAPWPEAVRLHTDRDLAAVVAAAQRETDASLAR